MSPDFERAGEVLGNPGEAVGAISASASSASATPPEAAYASPKAPERTCPHCNRELIAEWVPFPPALQQKYGREGEWWVPPCTPQCQAKEDQREWELGIRARRREDLLRRSGMPPRLARCTFETFEERFSEAAAAGMRAAVAYVKGWRERREITVEARGRGLYLCGGLGTGKTHVAAALAQELMVRYGVPTLFVTVPELLDRLRPGSPDEPDERAGWMDAAMGAELLVLDDLGAESESEWVRERLFLLINHRYREDLPTIFTSNIGPRDLEAKLGGRIASRLVETCEFVLMSGPDHRVESRRSSAGQRKGRTS